MCYKHLLINVQSQQRLIYAPFTYENSYVNMVAEEMLAFYTKAVSDGTVPPPPTVLCVGQ